MEFYGDAAKGETLAGVSTGDVTDEMQEAINDWIDANIRSTGFGESELVEQYYDIKKIGQNELILKNFPVTELSEIIEGTNTQISDTLVENTDFVLDNDTGIIQLLCNKAFRKGFNIVKVKYKYGFTSVPQLIIQIATLMAAKWAKLRSQTIPVGDGGEVVKSVRIGDYSESYDLGFMTVKSEFDDMLSPMIKSAKEIYADGV